MTLAELLEVVRPDWQVDAACRGRTALFYGDDEFSQRVAVQVCAGCSVRNECEAEVRTTEPPWWGRFGTWAGMTAEQRRRQWDRRRDLTSPD